VAKKNRGFSLIELVIIVTIMMVLVGILAPNLLRYLTDSRKEACASNKGEYYRVYNLFLFFEEPEGDPTLESFYAFAAKNNLADRTLICPSHGTCFFEIDHRALYITCSVHDDAIPTQLYIYDTPWLGAATQEMLDKLKPDALMNAKILYNQASRILAEQIANNASYKGIAQVNVKGNGVENKLYGDVILPDDPDNPGQKVVFGDVQIMFTADDKGNYTQISHVFFHYKSFWIKYSPSAVQYGVGDKGAYKDPPDPSLSK